jgi:YtcA family
MPFELKSPTAVEPLRETEREAVPANPRRYVILGGAACLLGGCSLKGAPSYSIFGAFFPAWLLCAGIGIAGSIGLRSLFIATGLEAEMPFRPLMYFAFAAALTLSIWLLLFWTN